MKGKTVAAVGKWEILPVGDVENYLIGLNTRDGMAIIENGEVATFKAIAIWDIIRGEVVGQRGISILPLLTVPQ